VRDKRRAQGGGDTGGRRKLSGGVAAGHGRRGLYYLAANGALAVYGVIFYLRGTPLQQLVPAEILTAIAGNLAVALGLRFGIRHRGAKPPRPDAR